MAFKIRRVDTRHDITRKAVVKIDDAGLNQGTTRNNMAAQTIWTTDDLPVEFRQDDLDTGARNVVATIKNGSVFRVVEFRPGVERRTHRTDSIDYAMVMSGEIDLELDDERVHLKAGDVLVQRGTMHNWVNNGTEPCVIAFVLISSLGETATG